MTGDELLDLKQNLHPSSFTREVSDATSLDDLSLGESAVSDRYSVPDELGGGPVRITNLGAGILSDLAFCDADGRLIYETTRYGLMPRQWEGAGFVNDGIVHVKNVSVTRPHGIRSIDTIIHATADWDWNFQHFLTESFPRLYYLSMILPSENAIPVSVGDYEHVHEVVRVCFPRMKVLPLKRAEIIAVNKTCFFVTPVFKNIGIHSDLSRQAFCFLRNAYLGAWSAKSRGPERAYFGRAINPLYAGNSRVLLNSDGLLDVASRSGFAEVFFDGMSNLQKMDLMNGMKHAIMPIGANLMNLVFAPNPIRVGVIEHPLFRPTAWFKDMLSHAGAPVDIIGPFAKTQLAEGAPQVANSPFVADKDAFASYVKKVLAED